MLIRSPAVTFPSSEVLSVRYLHLSKQNYITICHPGTFQCPYRLKNILIMRGVMGLLRQVDNIVEH